MVEKYFTDKQKAFLFSEANIKRLRSVSSHSPWNKGLTKSVDERLKSLGIKVALNAATNLHFGNRGRKFNMEHRMKISQANLGKHLTEATKKKMSIAKMGRKFPDWVNKKKGLAGEKNPFYGRHHTLKSRKLMSAKHKKRWFDDRERLLKIHMSYLDARLRGLMMRPTSFERFVIDLIHKYSLPFRYVGDGSCIINYVNPDFIATDDAKYIIETYTSWCHPVDYEKTRAERFSKMGYKTLFLGDSDIRNECAEFICLGKIRMFRGEIEMSSMFWISDEQFDCLMSSLQGLDLAQVCKTLLEVQENQFIGNISDPTKEKVAIVPICLRLANESHAGKDKNDRSPTRRWRC